MALPSSFPAWVSRPGFPDALVFDAVGYNAATAQGFVYPVNAAGQPITTSTAASAQLTTRQVSLNIEQDDGRPGLARGRGSQVGGH